MTRPPQHPRPGADPTVPQLPVPSSVPAPLAATAAAPLVPAGPGHAPPSPGPIAPGLETLPAGPAPDVPAPRAGTLPLGPPPAGSSSAESVPAEPSPAEPRPAEPAPAEPPGIEPSRVEPSDVEASPADTPDADGDASSRAVRRTMRLSLVEGGLAQVFLNWTSGAVLTGWMLHLGAGPTELALVASVPLLAQTVSPLAAWLAGVLGHRRLLTAVFALVGRSSWLLAAALPLLAVPAAARPTLMVLLVFVASVFQACTGTLWATWMGDVVPAERRGRYFGMRTGVVGVIGTVANVGAGLFLDRVAAPISFQLVLLLAVASALAAVATLFRHHDPPSERVPLPLSRVLGAPLSDPGFRRYLRFSVYWNFAVMLAAPFVLPYFLDALGMGFAQTALWSAIAAVTALGTTVAWGSVADRFGNRAVLQIGTFLAGSTLPALWIAAGWTGDLGYVWASAVLDAVAWGGIGPAVFNLSLATAPRGERASYLAMAGLAGGLAGFLGGLASGPLLTLLTPLAFDLGAVRVSGYHLLFALSAALRMQAWRLVRAVPEASAWRTRDVLRAMRTQWRAMGFFWRAG